MDTNFAFAQKREALTRLSQELSTTIIPTAEEWGGADVVITSQQPKPLNNSFYSEPKYVVTTDAKQLSWLFYQLRDIFSGLYDSVSKIEFFGRLANAALRYQSKNKDSKNQRDLLFAVLHEAFAMLDEMEEGSFEYLLIAPENVIVDDFIERAEMRGFIGIDETKKFFSEKGIEL